MRRPTFDRKVAVIGRSMEQNFRIASDLGYLTYDPARIVAKDRLKRRPDNKLVIATTGAQGEPMAGLARMANRDHRFVEIKPGDTVIVSASPIPGNEEYVAGPSTTSSRPARTSIYHTIKRAHVSGHASQEELKLMLGLTKPKHFIPIHGEFRMQVQHGRLAIETGRRAGERLHHRERPADRVPRGRQRPPRPARRGRLRLRRRPVGRRGRRRRPARPSGPRQRRHVHDRGHGRQADRQHHRPARDHHPRLRPPHEHDPIIERGDRAGHRRRSRTPATTSARSPSSRARSRTACRASCTSRRSAGRWSSRSWSRSERWPPVVEPPRHAGRAAGPACALPSIALPAGRRPRSPARWSGSSCWSSAWSRSSP